jgi:hypothetical protein
MVILLLLRLSSRSALGLMGLYIKLVLELEKT